MFADRTGWNLTQNRLSEILARHRANGKRLLDLSASNPTECGFAYDQQKILGALSNPQALRYEPNPRGLEIARNAVAEYYAEQGSEVAIDDIFLTTSTSEAYSFAFRTLCNAGDEILVPQPSYPLFDFLADIQDVKLARYSLIYEERKSGAAWSVDFDSLQKAITHRTRGVIVVHPNNPTGNFLKQEEALQLNEICGGHEMAILADEVFLDFALDRSKHQHTLAANGAALTFTMSGISKISGLPQMKVAWLVVSGPEKWKAEALARLEVIADTYLSVNAPIQLALPVFLEQRREFQAQLLARVQRNLAEMDRQLAAQKKCRRMEVEGGWYAVLHVPATGTDEEIAIRLLTEKEVYVHPGHFYDFSEDGYLVVSLITREDDFAEGMKRVVSSF